MWYIHKEWKSFLDICIDIALLSHGTVVFLMFLVYLLEFFQHDAGGVIFAYYWGAEASICVSSSMFFPTMIYLFSLNMYCTLVPLWNILLLLLPPWVMITGHLLGLGGIWNCWWKVLCFIHHWKVVWCGRVIFKWWNRQGIPLFSRHLKYYFFCGIFFYNWFMLNYLTLVFSPSVPCPF